MVAFCHGEEGRRADAQREKVIEILLADIYPFKVKEGETILSYSFNSELTAFRIELDSFLDRLHCYIPGWEIPKFRPEHFTNDYCFITDYLAEFIRELRKEQYGKEDFYAIYFTRGSGKSKGNGFADLS